MEFLIVVDVFFRYILVRKLFNFIFIVVYREMFMIVILLVILKSDNGLCYSFIEFYNFLQCYSIMDKIWMILLLLVVLWGVFFCYLSLGIGFIVCLLRSMWEVCCMGGVWGNVLWKKVLKYDIFFIFFYRIMGQLFFFLCVYLSRVICGNRVGLCCYCMVFRFNVVYVVKICGFFVGYIYFFFISILLYFQFKVYFNLWGFLFYYCVCSFWYKGGLSLWS